MSKYKHFNSTEAGELAGGTSRQVIDHLIRSAEIDLVRRGIRGRDAHLLDESAVYALRTGRTCRQCGMSLAAAGAVMKFVGSFGLEKLRAEFAAGRTCIVVVGDDTGGPLLAPEHAAGPFAANVRRFIEPFKPIWIVDLSDGLEAFDTQVAALLAKREALTAAARA